MTDDNVDTKDVVTDDVNDTSSDTSKQVVDTVITSEPKSDAVQQNFPDNWRQLIAGEDAKELENLKRYATPSDIWKKARELEKKLSSGQVMKPPTKDSTPEQVAAWRKANGIPEGADKYQLPEGIIVGEDDKPVVNEFLKTAHASNMSEDQVKQNLKWYFSVRDKQISLRNEEDSNFKLEAEQALKNDWGGEFKLNINMINSLVSETMPSGLFDRLQYGRTSDGKVLGNDVEFTKWMASIARKINPDAAVMPNFDGNRVQAISDELAQLKKEAGNTGKDSTYWHGPLSEQKQKRMQELLGAQIALKQR